MHKIVLFTCLLMAGALEQGTIHIQFETNVYQQRIEFDKPTKNIPQVAISLLSSGGEVFAEVHDITTEGFTLQMMATQQLEADFAYIAIDEGYQIECFNKRVTREIQFPLTISKPTYIGVLATNIHANNFNIGMQYIKIDYLDGNLIVDSDGQLNMCIIITNQETPIILPGYSNYEAKEEAQFHAFKKQNAMSLVQAQQSLEINHLDEHKSIEIWHHHSVEIIKDSSLEVYPTHLSLEVVDDSKHKSIEIIPEEYQQKESLEIFKVEEENTEKPQQLIAEDVNLENIIISDDAVTQENVNTEEVKLNEEDVKLDTEDIKLDTEDVRLDTEDVKLDTEDVKLDTEDIKLNTEDINTEDVKLDTEDIKLDTEDINTEDVKLDTEDIKLDNAAEDVKLDTEDVKLDTEDVKLNTDDVKLENVAEDVKLDNSENVNQDIVAEDVILENASEDVKLDTQDLNSENDTEDIKLIVQNDQLNETSDENQQTVQIENNDQFSNSENTTDESTLEDIKLDDTNSKQENSISDLENIKLDDTKVEIIKLEDIPVEQQAQVITSVENETQPQNEEQEVEVHANEVKIENAIVQEVNPEEIKIESPEQTFIPDEKEQEIEDMLRAAQQLKEEVKELKKKSKYEQFDEKRQIKERAQQLEEQVQEIEESDQPQVVEDDINLDVNAGFDEPETTVVETVEQPPIIYLNDDGVNPEQQLISQDIQEDVIQQEIDTELQTQELQQENTEEQVIVDDSIKLEEDHQELEPYSSETIKIEEEVVNLDDQIETQEFEIDLTTDEAEPFIKKPKKSDFLREKQRLKDKLTNVIKDLRLDSLDAVEDDQKKYSLIVDRLDVPENNENVIVLKDDDYQQNEEVQSTQVVEHLGDYLEEVEPSVENVNFMYDDEVQEQTPIQVEDITLDDATTYDDAETNYTVVEAKEDDTESLQIVDEPEQELISSEVVVSDQGQEKEQEISLDEFQKELDELANTIGAIKQESQSSERQSDYIVVNDNSQIYESSYDVQSYDSLQQDNDVQEVQEDQTQYYQAEEQSNEPQIEQEVTIEQVDQQESNDDQQIEQSDNQESQNDQQLEQQDDIQQEQQDNEQQEVNIEQQDDQVSIEEQQQSIPDDQPMQEQRYDDAEPQDQYLTIDNLVADNSSQEQDDAYEQPPQYYDQQEQQQEQENDEDNQFVVMKAEDFKQGIEPTQQEQQNDESIEEAQEVIEQTSEKQIDENEIDIIVDVASDDSNTLSSDQDYDYDFQEEKQQPQQQQPQQQQPQQQQPKQQEQVIQAVEPVKIKKNKNKLQHSITISHNQNNGDRSIHVQHSDMDESQEEMKQDLKQQLKQELKEELKQELQKEMQQEKMTHQSHSLVVEDKVEKNPERPAQKAINEFNNLLHDMVDNTLKDSDNDRHHKLPVVDVNKEAFKNVEPQIEAGIEDLKKALGLKGGVQVVAPDGTKQVINVDDLKKESEKLLSQPKSRKDDDSKYEEYLKKVTVKQAPSAESYEEQHNIRKQEILENIKRELEIKKGRFTVPNDTPQGIYQLNQELSPYEFERVYLDWEKNKQDIIPSMLQHSIDQPIASEQIPEVQQQKSDRMSRKEEVEKEVQELLYGNQKNNNKKGKMKEFRVEDLKYIKDDPLLDSTYHGFVQVKANLRKRKD